MNKNELQPMRVKVTTELWKNADGKHLNLVTDILGKITKKVIDLEEKATIDALVRLGWIPPSPTPSAAGLDVDGLKCLHSDIQTELSLLGDTEKVKRIYKAMIEAALQSPVDGWMDIETAPRKGRDAIYIWGPNYSEPQKAYADTWWTAGFSAENKPTMWHELPQPPQKGESNEQ